MENASTRRKKLKFRSEHRGIKEMDILLGGFAAASLDEFSDTELDQFETLLNESDDDIYAWVMDRTAVPAPADTAVFRAFKAHVRDRGRGISN
jgi:antitoxin CptB